MKEYVYVFMSATREKIKEKRKMLEDQNAKDTAHYIKESSDLERELCHQSCVQGFLNIKTIGCNNLNSGCRKGELKKKKKETKAGQLDTGETNQTGTKSRTGGKTKAGSRNVRHR